jgi:hypothetical protein
MLSIEDSVKSMSSTFDRKYYNKHASSLLGQDSATTSAVSHVAE